MTKENFVTTTYDAAYKRLKEIGKDDKAADFYARILASHACLESDFGTRETGAYNYFGLKATPEQDAKVVTTHEFSGSNRKKIQDRFLNFKSAEDGIRYAVDRIGTKFHAFDGNLTPESYVDTIHKYHYFTDDRDNYLKNIKGVMNGSVVPAALKEHKAPQHLQQGITIPPQPKPQLIHRNDATMVAKPILPPRLSRGGVFSATQVMKAREFLKNQSIFR